MPNVAVAIGSKQATLRRIRREDDAQVGFIIRSVLTEFGCTGEGFAIHDPEVDCMYEAYERARGVYFVAEIDGKVVGGCGVTPLAGTYQNICEIQKFYVLPEYRGMGLGRRLIERCLEFAGDQNFNRAYIETIERMDAAAALYRRLGFERIDTPLGNTGHHACDRWYMKILANG